MSKKNTYYGSLQSASPLLANLVAWYDFNNNALDALGVHNGTEVGTPSYVAGKIGNAINFQNDATNRYVSVPDSNDFSFTNGVNDLPFSISMWVQNLAISSIGNWYINKRNTQTLISEWQVVYSATTSTITFSLFTVDASSSIAVRSSAAPFALNTWAHIVVTYDGSGLATGLKIYINGVDVTTTQVTTGTYTGMVNTIAPVWIGQLGFTTTIAEAKHRGYIDLLGVWKNRQLTPADVTELYNAGLGITYPF
jgi:hypothetical protein